MKTFINVFFFYNLNIKIHFYLLLQVQERIIEINKIMAQFWTALRGELVHRFILHGIMQEQEDQAVAVEGAFSGDQYKRQVPINASSGGQAFR